MSRTQGFTDKAAVTDLFKIDGYTKGLSEFIRVCNTPMTISIQGSWGTGKTSIMNFIEENLVKDGTIEIVKFNTWQFSQFNMQDQLALSLISSMIKQIKIDTEQSTKLQGIASKLKKGFIGVTGSLAPVLLSSATGGLVSKEDVQEAVKGLSANNDDYDTASAIADLKEEFENCIRFSLEKNHKDRIVFFVDDLDRLEPRKAVELLEVMKLFFDVENCIFILAIDYDVVIKGVADKYGRFFKDEKENLEKGKSFFDKIIQVPFKMPVGKYDLSNYVQQCFADIGVPCMPEELPTYVELINLSVGGNPRSMKRLFNAFLLLTKIVDKEILEKDKSKQLLFAVLCLQYSYDNVYNYILRERENLNESLLRNLEDPNWDYTQTGGAIDLSDVDRDGLQRFMQKFNATIDYSVNGEYDNRLDDKEIEMLKGVLGVASITGSSQESENIEDNTRAKKKYRYTFMTDGHGHDYESGSRSGKSLGNLCHAIIQDAAKKCSWNADKALKFRDAFLKKGGTGWLNEVIIFANEVKKINSELMKDDTTQYKGVKKTINIEKFKDRYFSYMEKDDVLFDEERAKDKSVNEERQPVECADGTVFFVAKYWGKNDIERLLKTISEVFGYKPDVVEKF